MSPPGICITRRSTRIFPWIGRKEPTTTMSAPRVSCSRSRSAGPEARRDRAARASAPPGPPCSPRITRILPPAASSVVSISANALSSQRVSGLGERLLKSSTAMAWRTPPACPGAASGRGPRCWRMWAAVAITRPPPASQAAQAGGRRQRRAGAGGEDRRGSGGRRAATAGGGSPGGIGVSRQRRGTESGARRRPARRGPSITTMGISAVSDSARSAAARPRTSTPGRGR